MRYTFQLCEGRHPIPGNPPAIFPATATVDPTDTIAMRNCADFIIPSDADEIAVYVTGSTSAMLAVVRVCAHRGIALTALHYNKITETYFPQRVLW